MKKRLRTLWGWIVGVWAQLVALFRWPRTRFPSLAPPLVTAPEGRRTGRRVLRVVFLADEPERLEPDVLYAIGENGHLWQATLACPCGCEARITLNLLPDDSPRWRLRVDDDVPTLSPSIWRTTGCRSHFFVRRGQIDWCTNQPRSADQGAASF